MNRGLEKFLLLLVGPFPDLYRSLAMSAYVSGRELDSLVTCESLNGRFAVHASSLSFYSYVLSLYPLTRRHECQDAARSVVRCEGGMSSVGTSLSDVAAVARRALPDELSIVKGAVEGVGVGVSDERAAKALKAFKGRVREAEDKASRDAPGGGDTNNAKTKRERLLDEARELLDDAAFEGKGFRNARGRIADIYGECGMKDLKALVEGA